MASLSLRNVYKRYPGGVTAVSDFKIGRASCRERV